MINTYYAELFDIDTISDRFTSILDSVAKVARQKMISQQKNWQTKNRGVVSIDDKSFETRFIYVAPSKEDKPVYLFNDVDTKPHKIAPKKAGALAFKWGKIGGNQVFVPKGGGFKTHFRKNGTLMIGKGFVQHPGTTGKNLRGDVIDDMVAELDRLIGLIQL